MAESNGRDAASAPRGAEAALADAHAALDRVGDDWIGRSGVQSISVARPWREGVPVEDGVCIRVTLERLLPAEAVPEGELFPDEIDGVEVQLFVGGAAEPEEQQEQRA